MMDKLRIGILGGGQLAKMSAQEARRMGFEVLVLDPTPGCPASMVAEQIIGSFKDEEKIVELAERVDVVTYDIEGVNVDALKKVAKEKPVIPEPHVLEVIRDKYVQRKVMKKAGVPVPWFRGLKSLDELENLIPVVQKARSGGYDGRGVVVIRDEKDLQKALNVPSYVEELVPIKKELSVIVVRNDDETLAYPTTEMVFNGEGNILDFLVAPGRLERDVEEEAEEIAIRAVESLDGRGVFGVEMFLAEDGRILVNEIAPRPHNSGHWTIEAAISSQFEQHVRVVADLPPGSTEIVLNAAMVNLLGEKGYYGKPVYEGIREALRIPGVFVHIYGKREVFPFRKMGHVTAVDKTLSRAIEKALRAKELIRVRGEVNAQGGNNNG
ncbi:Phosphoribosylaminoimidazole carboxylase ATPase subunit [Thermococcus sp. 2319x1]|uniref:5-(carboxyamino)imidazole ribonucleotide synthase n=1 Tax=Thermococcus sp. 2319x1 TaxID=1674923 RepID=UPI00073AAF22|nr:5-(carboxyamino)imidazole ribonucleotide synthase [Thermococcus sp. 2319x1]ALV63487.1 Phosphoribosylaminoimidazole carboxylase ATPase subunit [Thermococcus sp. 2319x1]